MDDFESCLAHLTKILEVWVRKQLVLSWEKSHFMVREGVVLEHIVLGKGLEVDKAKIEVKPPSSKYCSRFEELSWACGLLPEIYRRLCESLQPTRHPSLQRQRLHN